MRFLPDKADGMALDADRTRATITVDGPWLIAYRRTLARRAAGRLYDLCQTAARL